MCYRAEIEKMLKAVDATRDALLSLHYYLPQKHSNDYHDHAANVESSLHDMLAHPWEKIWAAVDAEDEGGIDETDTRGLPRELPSYFTRNGDVIGVDELRKLEVELAHTAPDWKCKFPPVYFWNKYSNTETLRPVPTNPATMGVGQ